MSEILSNGDRTIETVTRLMIPNLDAPRYSLSDIYSQQCSCLATDPSGQAVYGIDYLRYWDCCGAATVTIENKIEQALDLVKNHLMFAVREEVRALNEEIQDLLNKNEQLEYENRILRSQASPETLTRLHSLLADLYNRRHLSSSLSR